MTSIYSGFEPSDWAAIAGAKSLNDPDRQVQAVNRIVSHPFATKVRGFHQNDIALIELYQNLDFDELVQPICLGDKLPEQGDMCIIAGWINTAPTQGIFYHSSKSRRATLSIKVAQSLQIIMLEVLSDFLLRATTEKVAALFLNDVTSFLLFFTT